MCWEYDVFDAGEILLLFLLHTSSFFVFPYKVSAMLVQKSYRDEVTTLYKSQKRK
jgi:hypothetical protein